MSSTSAGGSATTWKGRAASGSQNVEKEREGWIGHLLARREFDVSGLAVAPSTPRRAQSMDFIDFDVSERAPPGPGGGGVLVMIIDI